MTIDPNTEPQVGEPGAGTVVTPEEPLPAATQPALEASSGQG